MYLGTVPGNPIYVQGTKYDAAGRVTKRTLGSANPVQTQYTYYAWNTAIHGGKLQQIYTTRGTTPLQNFQYAYDSNANITTIQDYIMGSPQTQSFGYDNLDRLTSAQAANGTQGNYGPEGYTYDAATGNLATKNGAAYDYGAQSAECDLPGLDKAHAAVSAGSSKFYCYDQNGNMVRRKIDGVIYTLTYDAENHITGYSGGGVNATFVYDGDGRRVQSTVNGVTTQFVGSHVEWKTSTTDMLRYYYAGGVRVAMRTGDAGLVWLVGDHLGSTSIAVTDSSGATERQGYKAWGEFRFGSLPTKYQFTGQRNEPTLGLYYYGARWYDSDLARFAQADTIIPDPYNSLDYDRYQYVRSRPMIYTDPTGHIPAKEICDYLGICDEEEFIKRYGQALHDLLWDTNVTWGDKLEWTENGKRQIAMLILISGDGEHYIGVLWGIEGDFVGVPNYFDRLTEADEGSVDITDRHPDIDDVSDLPVAGGKYAYDGKYAWNPATYYKLNFGWWLLVVGGLASTPLTGWYGFAIAGVSLIVAFGDIAALAGLPPSLQYFWNQSFGGPGVAYPVMLLYPIAAAPTIRFSRPTGGR